jgi:hypothetical protein
MNSTICSSSEYSVSDDIIFAEMLGPLSVLFGIRGTTNIHLMLLDRVKRMVVVARNNHAVDEKLPSTNSQSISITQKKTSVSFPDKRPIPESAIPGEIFSIDQRSDIVWLITVVDYRVDTEMLVRNDWIIEDILAGYGQHNRIQRVMESSKSTIDRHPVR